MIQKKWKIFIQKNVKITKQAHDFKGFASSYNVEILNSFDPELHIKDTEFAIKYKWKKSCLNYEDLNLWQH